MSIEQARKNLLEQEALGRVSKAIFSLGIEILRQKGTARRHGLFKYQHLEHTVNSTKPNVAVWIISRANLEKSRKVSLFVEGLENGIAVKRIGEEDNEAYIAKQIYVGGYEYAYRWTSSALIDAGGFLNSLKQVASEIGITPRTA